MKIIVPSVFFMLLLMGCSSLPKATQLSSLESPTAAPSYSPGPSRESTPTDWLHYNPNYTADRCDEFTASLPRPGMEDLSQLEISRMLFEIYLGHYRSPDLGSLCRLEDFKVENVQDRFADLAGEQNVDFVNTVQYSVRLPKRPQPGQPEMENYPPMAGSFIRL